MPIFSKNAGVSKFYMKSLPCIILFAILTLSASRSFAIVSGLEYSLVLDALKISQEEGDRYIYISALAAGKKFQLIVAAATDFEKQFPNSENLSSVRFLKASALISLGNYDEAKVALNAVILANPNSNQAFLAKLKLADCLFMSKEYDDALIQFKTLLDSPEYKKYNAIVNQRVALASKKSGQNSDSEAALYLARNATKDSTFLASLKQVEALSVDTDFSPTLRPKSEAFWVQLAAYTTREYADKKQIELKAKSYSPTIREEEKNGKKLFKVLIGPFTTEGNAQTKVNELSDNGVYSFITKF